MLQIGGIDHKMLRYNNYRSDNGYPRETERPYFRASKHHIFIDPAYVNHSEVPELLDKIAKKGNQHVHIFISEHYMGVQKRVLEFIAFINRDPAPGTKIFVHVPKGDPITGDMIEKMSKNIGAKVKVVKEGRGVSYFASEDILRKRFYRISLSYEPDGLKVDISTGTYKNSRMHGTNGNPDKKRPDGPITPDMLGNMEQFKEKIIAGFKAACPPGILKGFKDDEDLWAYINDCQMTVRVEGEEENGKTP